jgi:hypothetical protein
MRKLFLFILITLFCVGAFAATDPVSASEDAVAYVEQLIADHPEWTEEQLEFLDALIGVVSEPWAYSPERSKRQTALVKVMVRELEALFSQEDLILFGKAGRQRYEGRSFGGGGTCQMPECDCYGPYYDCGSVWDYYCTNTGGHECREDTSYPKCGPLWLITCDKMCVERRRH